MRRTGLKKSAIPLGILLLCLWGPLHGGDLLSFKFKGGYGYSEIGDLNTYLRYMNGSLKSNWDQTAGSFKLLHEEPLIEAELDIFLFPRFSIGVGAEYLRLEQKAGTSKISLLMNGSAVTTYDHVSRISAFPVKLTMTYFPILGRGVRLGFRIGAGYYHVDFKTTFISSGPTYYFNRTQEGSAKSAAARIGFHGGLALELSLMRHVAFLVEVEGRYAKIRGLSGSGKWQDSSGGNGQWSGTLYIYEYWQQPWWTTFLYLWPEPPNGSNYRNVREAKVDLSGASVKGGLVLRF